MTDSSHDARARLRAELRFALIAPLLTQPPGPGELKTRLLAMANTPVYDRVSKREVRLGASTLERWYYRAKDVSDPISALTDKTRCDVGTSKVLGPEHLEVLESQHRAHPSWTYQLHADNLKAECKANPSLLRTIPSYSVVRRAMQGRGWLRSTKRFPDTEGGRRAQHAHEHLETRSYEVAHVLGLWHLDFHHGSQRVVLPDGSWVTPHCMAILDDNSRLCCHIQWYVHETAETLIHALIQAIEKRGLPRALMHDNGAAMMAEATQNGLRDIGITARPTLPYSPQQNGKQEKFWGGLEGRLVAMLDGVKNLTLEFLNRATQAWVEREYHRARHNELATSPLSAFLERPSVRRDPPARDVLTRAFTDQVQRVQRRSDGTITIEGVRFEVPDHLRTLPRVTVRFRPWDKREAWIVDERHPMTPIATIRPIDKTKNADGRRRERSAPTPIPTTPAQGGGVPALLRQYLEEYAASGLPPAYLALDSSDDDAHAADGSRLEDTHV
jgi:putative transposase